MKVLVTGVCGFLGSHIGEALINAGHDVIGVDDLSTGKLEWFPSARVTSFSACGYGDHDAVIHCAARADISRNWDPNHNRHEIFQTNVMGTIEMLENIAESPHKPKRFIFISTAAIGAPQSSPYVASKIAGEAYCKAYCQALGIDLTVIRPVSMLGKRYHHGHIVDFVRMAKRDGVIRARDDGSQRKPYTHVSQVADVVIACLEIHPFLGSQAIDLIRVPGVAWGIDSTAALIGCPIEHTTAQRGWIGDPDVTDFIEGNAAPWVRETIDWVREHG